MALGEAFISVHADLKPFRRELDTELKRILKDLDLRLSRSGRDSADSFINGFLERFKRRQGSILKSLSTTFSRVRPRINPEVDERGLLRTMQGAVSRINRRLGRTTSFFGPLSFLKGRSGIDNLGRGFAGFGRSVQKVFKSLGSAGEGFLSLLGEIGRVGKSVFKAIGTVVSSLGAALRIVAVTLGPAGIIGAAIQLGAELRRVVGIAALLPGAMAVVAAAIAPVQVAFLGISETVDALVKGDLEEFRDQIKNLSPSAQKFVRVIERTLPQLRRMRTVVQEAFFSGGGFLGSEGLGGGLENAVRVLLPKLQAGFGNVAAAAGRFAGALLGLAEDQNVKNLLTNLFPTVARIIDILRPAVMGALSALANAANASLPTIEELSSKLAGLINRFTTWLNESIAAGEFQEWVDTALTTLEDLKGVVEGVLGVLDALFDRADEGGETFLRDLGKALERLERFLRSEEGKKFIDRMIVAAKALVAVIVFMAQAIATVSGAVGGVKRAWDRATGALNAAGQALKRFLGLQNSLSSVGSVGAAAVRAAIPGLAHGGIVNRPTLAMIGEGGGPEAVVPLNNPRRAQEVMRQAGLDRFSSPTVNVFIGNEQLDARMARVVQGANRRAARAITFQPRAV